MRKRKRVRTDGSPRIGTKAGSPYLHVLWSEGGRSRRLSTGTADPTRAEGFLIDWLASRTPKPKNPTVNQIADAYHADRVEAGVVFPATIAQRLKPIREFFGAGLVSSVTHDRVRAYVRKRRGDGIKPAPGAKSPRTGPVKDATIDAELRALRQALAWAEKHGWIDRAPYVETPGGNQPRRRFLAPSEVAALVAALEDKKTRSHTRTLVLIALWTAQRGVSIRELKWEHVDFERGVLWFPPGRSKLKNRVSVKIGPALLGHLAHVKAALFAAAEDGERAPPTYVVEWLGEPIASARKAFAGVVARAGLKDVRFHDLRRTAASLALQRGASFAEVAALLGDDEAIVRQHYAMFEPEFLSGIVARLEHLACAPVGHIEAAESGETNA